MSKLGVVNAAGGPFVDQTVRWIPAHKDAEKSKNRGCRIVCAALVLGNVVQKGSCSIYALVRKISLRKCADTCSRVVIDPPIALALTWRHYWSLRRTPAKAQCRQPVASSSLVSDKVDVLEMQVYAIGIAKHLCSGESKSYALWNPNAGILIPLNT